MSKIQIFKEAKCKVKKILLNLSLQIENALKQQFLLWD